MSRSRDLADLGGVTTRLDQVGNSEGALSNRNMVLNGSMAVAQRATSVTGLGGNADAYNTLDRFKLSAEGSMAGRLTMSKTADGPNGISANCLKLDCTTADTSIAAGEALILSTYLEGQNVQRLGKGIAGAKQSVISFYVKASSSLTFAIELFDGDNARHIVKLFTATTGWNRIEFNIPADEDDGSSALDDDNAASLYINFWLHGGSTFTGGTLATAWANKTNNNTRAAGIDSFFSSTDNNFFLTGLQFELGTATPFEHISFGDQLQKCQRYFQRLEWKGGNTIVAQAYSDTSGICGLDYTRKRAEPTFTLPTATSGTNQANGISFLTAAGSYRGGTGTVTASHISRDSCRINFSNWASSGAAGDATWAYFTSNDSSDTCFIHIDAEL